MSKIKSRMDYARELQDEIKGVVMYSYERLQSLRDVNIRLHQTGEVWFEDSFEGHRDELKLKEKEEKAVKLYKELDSFTKQTKYNEIYRDFLVAIKDEDDEKKWLGIYNKYRDDIRDLKIDMNSKYQKFLADMTEIFKIVTTQKRKEREFKMKETPIEEFVRNADQIRKVLYEKCSAGMITLEQREASLAKLNAYVESAERFTSEVNGAVEAYCEGELTCEELDNIVSGYYRENPQQAMYYEGLHIDNRFKAMKNEIVGLYKEGVLSLEDARMSLDYLDQLYDVQMYEHGEYLENGEVPTLEFTVSEAMNHYFNRIKTFNESASDEESDYAERVNGLNDFNAETATYFEGAGEVILSSVVIGAYLACIAAVISIPVGKVINAKKGSKLIKAYEELHPDAVKFKSLRISKMSIEKTGAQYIPEIKKLVDGNLNTSGRCFLAKHGGKPFAVIASIFASSTTAVITSDGVGSASTYSNTRYYFKALCPEAVAHKEFYEAALMLKKFKVSTPEIKAFCKDMKAELQDLRKEQAQAEKDKIDAEKKAKSAAEAKIAKESAGIEYDNDKIYQYVREQLMQKYVDGEITLEQREGALMEARDRLFGDDMDLIQESLFDNFVKKITDKKKGSTDNSAFQKVKAAYAANNAEINRLNTKIKSLEKMEAQKSDPTTLKKCADEIKRLQAKVQKLVSNNDTLSKQMQACMVGESVVGNVKKGISNAATNVRNKGYDVLNSVEDSINDAKDARKKAKYDTRTHAMKKDADKINKSIEQEKKLRQKKEENRNKMSMNSYLKKWNAEDMNDEDAHALYIANAKRKDKKYDRENRKLERDNIKLQNKIKKVGDARASITKENADAIYRSVCEQAFDKFIYEELSYNTMNALIESARDRIETTEDYDVIEEGVLQKISDKIQDQKISGSVEQLRAKYLSNMQEVKRTEKRINELKQVLDRRDIDPIVAKKTAREINQLQAKAKKLESDANFAYKKMSAQDFKNAPREKFNNKLAQTKPVAQ